MDMRSEHQLRITNIISNFVYFNHKFKCLMDQFLFHMFQLFQCHPVLLHFLDHMLHQYLLKHHLKVDM